MNIELTQGQVAIVDSEDYAEVSQHKWYAWWNPATKSFYAVRNSRPKGTLPQRIYMHRFILSAAPPAWVDHANHDTLDNRRSNIRLCTPSQNMCNRRYPNKHGYRGVASTAPGTLKPFLAQIRLNGKRVILGYFDTPALAAEVWNEAARKAYGEFALLNEVEHGS